MSAPKSLLGQKIEQLEKAVQNVNNAKRQLGRKNVEVKSQIQTNVSRQLEALRNREVWLLNQVDMVTGAKEEGLQQQQARLNKALGILQSGIVYPELGDSLYNWERKLQLLDVDDLQPEESPFISFKADSKGLRDVIMNYGKVVDSPISIKTSFMEPDRPSLCLPPHLEEYEDAQHHVLYKTLEEISRSKTKEPYVSVHLPKLSPRLEDWLAVPSTITTPSNTTHKLSLPNFSNKTSDWLKQPFTMDTVPPVTSISSDVSIQTWLHKIKQDPCEEQEEDFELIEEQAEWSSGLGSNDRDKKSCLSSPSSPSQYWIFLKERDAEGALPEQNTSPIAEWLKQMKELPLEKWLLPKKTDEKVAQSTSKFENFFQNLNLDHTVWLLPQGGQKGKSCCQGNEESETLNQSTTCPIVCSHSASTDSCPVANISRFGKSTAIRNSDNPWLKTATSSTISDRSFTLPDKLQKDKDIKSWLLNGHVSDLPTTLPCLELEKYKARTKDICWLKSQQSKSGTEKQDMMDVKFSSKFESPTSVTCSDQSIWLRPLSNKEKTSNINPRASFSNFFDYQNGKETRFWLLHSDEAQMKEKNLVKSRTDETTSEKWLYLRQSPAATKQVQTTK